jgi:hypothetical protein
MKHHKVVIDFSGRGMVELFQRLIDRKTPPDRPGRSRSSLMTQPDSEVPRFLSKGAFGPPHKLHNLRYRRPCLRMLP